MTITQTKYKKNILAFGFLTAYFLFVTVLYFILLLSHHSFSYLHIMILVAFLNLSGWLLKKILK
mgnify:CR=1 FL=1